MEVKSRKHCLEMATTGTTCRDSSGSVLPVYVSGNPTRAEIALCGASPATDLHAKHSETPPTSTGKLRVGLEVDDAKPRQARGVRRRSCAGQAYGCRKLRCVCFGALDAVAL